MAKGGKTRGARVTRNPEILRGVRKYGSVASGQKRAAYKFAKLGANNKGTKPNPAPAARTSLNGRFYDADDVKIPLRSSKNTRRTPAVPLRKSIQPGTVVILLAGRFRGKRVIVLKQLKSGLLLVTGPYKVNGVPLRRVNQAYVIATSTQVDVSKVDVSAIDDAFFKRAAEKKAARTQDGEAFFAKDAKKSPVNAEAKKETARVGAAVLAVVKATPSLRQYLNAKFTLTRGQKPHAMKF